MLLDEEGTIGRHLSGPLELPLRPFLGLEVLETLLLKMVSNGNLCEAFLSSFSAS
jgi:hypothetical protein